MVVTNVPPPRPAGEGGAGAPPPPPPTSGPAQPGYPYSYPYPGYPPAYPPGPPTNTNAIIALVLGIIAVSGCGLAGIPALVLGYKSRREVRESGGQQQGDGLALAGIVLGWIGSILMLAMVGFFVAMIAFTFAVGSTVDTCDDRNADGTYREFNDC